MTNEITGRSAAFLLILAGLLPASAGQEPAPPEPDLRIQVILRNGSEMEGIAPKGRLVELLQRGRFAPAKSSKHRDSGVRVWHYLGSDGFVFVPYRRIREVKVLKKLSPGEAQSWRKRQEKQREPAREERTPPQPPAASEAPGLDDGERALLARFDPADGWSPRRFGEIQRRRLVEKKEPTPLEKEFLEVFEAWDAARRKAEPAPAPSPEKDA